MFKKCMYVYANVMGRDFYFKCPKYKNDNLMLLCSTILGSHDFNAGFQARMLHIPLTHTYLNA